MKIGNDPFDLILIFVIVTVIVLLVWFIVLILSPVWLPLFIYKIFKSLKEEP